MLPIILDISVPGPPIAQPRARHDRRGFVYGASRDHPIHAYRGAIRLAAQAGCRDPAAGPLEIELQFVFPRPKLKQYKKKAMPAEPHSVRPDLDNLTKGVKDALNGVAWRDDSQVARLVATKRLAAGTELPSTRIVVRTLC